MRSHVRSVSNGWFHTQRVTHLEQCSKVPFDRLPQSYVGINNFQQLQPIIEKCLLPQTIQLFGQSLISKPLDPLHRNKVSQELFSSQQLCEFQKQVQDGLEREHLEKHKSIISRKWMQLKFNFMLKRGIQQLRGQFLYPESGQKQTFFNPHLILSTQLLNGPLRQQDFSSIEERVRDRFPYRKKKL